VTLLIDDDGTVTDDETGEVARLLDPTDVAYVDPAGFPDARLLHPSYSSLPVEVALVAPSPWLLVIAASTLTLWGAVIVAAVRWLT
jgi:hypothetical protein